jgi:hypothetical protein
MHPDIARIPNISNSPFLKRATVVESATFGASGNFSSTAVLLGMALSGQIRDEHILECLGKHLGVGYLAGGVERRELDREDRCLCAA